jgi:hypothetical protein
MLFINGHSWRASTLASIHQFPNGARLPVNVECRGALKECSAAFLFSFEIALLRFLSRSFTSIRIALPLWPGFQRGVVRQMIGGDPPETHWDRAGQRAEIDW